MSAIKTVHVVCVNPESSVWVAYDALAPEDKKAASSAGEAIGLLLWESSNSPIDIVEIKA